MTGRPRKKDGDIRPERERRLGRWAARLTYLYPFRKMQNDYLPVNASEKHGKG
jgi:hypothetical protein